MVTASIQYSNVDPCRGHMHKCIWLAYAFTISVRKMAGDDTLDIPLVVYITMCCRNPYDIVHCNDLSLKCCVGTGINWSLRCP